MRFLLIVLSCAFFLVPSPATSTNNQVEKIWLYGAPNSWGALGYDTDGNPITTPEESAQSFFAWADQIETALGFSADLHADIILLSENGFNRLADETAAAILEYTDRTDITISFNIHVPQTWTIADIDSHISMIFEGDEFFMPIEFLNRHREKIALSLDLEMPVFEGNLYVTADDVNRLYLTYITFDHLPELYLYNFGNMVANADQLHSSIVPIFNGIGGDPDILAERFRNVEKQSGRPTGIMLFTLPHLGEQQRNRAFPIGDFETVVNWLNTSGIVTPILGFQ